MNIVTWLEKLPPKQKSQVETWLECDLEHDHQQQPNITRSYKSLNDQREPNTKNSHEHEHKQHEHDEYIFIAWLNTDWCESNQITAPLFLPLVMFFQYFFRVC